MNGTTRYTIRPYDTIWMLAQVFNTTVDAIMDLNPGIDPRNLMIGQVITIRPGFQHYPPYNGNNNGNSNGNGNVNGNGNMNGNGNLNGNGNMNGNMNGNGNSNGNSNGGAVDDVDSDLDDLMNHFRMLWEQHVFWTKLAVMGIIHDLPETDMILQRLLRNPSDFANAMSPFFGEEASQQFAELFTGHLTIAADLVKAAKAGDNEAVTEADQNWRENAEQIAELLGSMNPDWSDDDWSAMMNEHLDLLSADVSDLLAGNYQESVNNFDEIEMQALEMADMMAEGIAMQFPE